MDTTYRIRQRRNVAVQMISEDAFEGTPCINTLTNVRDEDSSIFGPYLTGCAYAPAGCYDVELTTRKIQELEFSVCMQESGGAAWYSAGHSSYYSTTHDGANPFEQIEVDTIVRFAFTITGGDAIGYIDDNNDIFISGATGFEIYNLLVSGTSNYIEVKELVGIYDRDSTGPLLLVLSMDNYPYILSTVNDAVQWGITGLPFGEMRIFTSDGTEEHGGSVVYESTPTIAYVQTNTFRDSIFHTFNHPIGKEWVFICHRQVWGSGDLSVMLIDEDGTVYTYGLNVGGILGLDPTVFPTINFLTELDTSSFFGNPVKVAIANGKRPVSFIITDTGLAYSAGQATDGRVWWGDEGNGHLLGRKPVVYADFDIPHRRISGKWREITTEFNKVYAIHEDGSLWGWGKTDDEYIGLESVSSSYIYGGVATEIPIALSFNTEWVSIWKSTYAINSCTDFTGTPSIAANKALGQRGSVNTTGSNAFEIADYYRADMEKVALGNNFALYLDSDGYVYGGGSPTRNHCGSKFDNYFESIAYIPSFGTVRDIWAFSQGSAYVDDSGDFYISGDGVPRINAGVETYGYTDYTIIPFALEVMEVVCNQYGMMVRLSDNTVWAWGSNLYYCLGQTAHQPSPLTPFWINTPTKILGEYQSISLGHWHGGGILIDGQLNMWGYDIASPDSLGLFGQGHSIGTSTTLKDSYADVQINSDLEVTRATPTNINISNGPDVFSEITCCREGTYVTVGKTDDSYVLDGYRVNGPRWVSGDVWGTGPDKDDSARNLLFEYHESWKYSGYWRHILYDGWESACTLGYLLEFDEYIDSYFSVGGTPSSTVIDETVTVFGTGGEPTGYYSVNTTESMLLRKCPYILHCARCTTVELYAIYAAYNNNFQFKDYWYVLDPGETVMPYISGNAVYQQISVSANGYGTFYYILEFTNGDPTSAFYDAYISS